MHDDRLKRLLQRADTGEALANSASLGPRIRQRAAERRRRRIAAGALGCAMVLAGAWAMWGMPRREAPIVMQPRKESVREKTPGAVAAAISLEVDPVADARNEAADTMVIMARHRATTAGPRKAIDLYQRVIALFPESRGAVIARAELAKLQTD